ncbi:hypothetical protein C824_006012 [Schaedlerella arabinosiphila]|jgi:hypothetical protein|nr:hypothetical protein C824_006012 [Schaedlerella arabinosiphila]
MAGIEERLDQMEVLIKNPSFRQTKGKANEVNYWVFDYAPEQELIIFNQYPEDNYYRAFRLVR